VAGPATVKRTLLRQGKSVTQMRAELVQDGQVVVSALASFGAARPSIIKQSAVKHVNLGQPEDGLVMPNIEVVPEFVKHFDMSITIGGLPFSGHRSRSFGGWVRLKQAPLGLNEAYIAALVDAWPPALLPHLVQPAPASSLTWTLEFIEPLPQASAADWWQYQADIEYAADGYGYCAARLCDAEGKLVAISRQTVTVFA
ncbi:acyl-CoA thioesterase, partial [Idiomarina xiamenensis]